MKQSCNKKEKKEQIYILKREYSKIILKEN
jgi:hypothetical protein